MSTYFGYAKGTGKKNNGAVVRYGGNANTNYPGYGVWPVTNVPTLSQFAYNPGQYSSIVPPITNTSGTGKALTAGTFAKMTKGQYVMRAYVTTSLAGVATTVLQSPAADYGRHSIHYERVFRYWNLYAWTWTANRDNSPSVSGTYQTGIAAVNSDVAATPTRAVPGQLVYRVGSPTPFQDTYKPKTD